MKHKDLADYLVDQLRDEIKHLTNEERMEIFSAIAEDYCKHCGSKYLPCHCNNDE